LFGNSTAFFAILMPPLRFNFAIEIFEL